MSVAGLTVIQPLTAAPPLLLAALLMDGGPGEFDSVGGIADAIQQRLLPSDSRGVMINFLSGPFGLWNGLDDPRPYGMVPSTALGASATMPFVDPRGWNVAPQLLPPLAPTGPATVPDLPAPGTPVVTFDLPSLQAGEAVVTPPAPDVPVAGPGSGDVLTRVGYDLSSYAAVSLLNPLAITNSVAAYLTRALSPVQINADGTVTCRLGTSCDGLDITTERIDGVLYVTFKNPDGSLVKAKVETRNGVTYVTYEDDGPLPLVRPLRDYFGLLGNELADVLEPALTALVYWGYRDATTGGGYSLLPTMTETIKALLDFVVGVKKGIESLFVPHSPDKANASLAADSEAFLPEQKPDEDKSAGPGYGSDDKTPVPEIVDDPVDDGEPAPDPELPVGADEEPATGEEPTDEEPADGEPTDEEIDSDDPADTPGATDPEDTDSGDTDPTDDASGANDERDAHWTSAEDRAAEKDEAARRDAA